MSNPEDQQNPEKSSFLEGANFDDSFESKGLPPLSNVDAASDATIADNETERKQRQFIQSIGPYRILREIGEGGMGSVFEAEQLEPVKRKVAIKVIKSGRDSKSVIARFEAERQALALMDHPSIARIIDAGTTELGQPFFAMELVDGIPLTQFCDMHWLSISERLNLFCQICNGIQHAHQKGIIHRDLKPGNILVTEYGGKPVPKIIDFGLAKALKTSLKLTDKSINTEFGQVLGTVKYMSPEQAGLDPMDIDTRSDIYSLGIILYELLTGSTPLDNSSIEENALLKVLELVREQDAQKPSSKIITNSNRASTISSKRQIEPKRLNSILAGELDWVVMKSLEKDRDRRYDSVSELADDLRRYLNEEPIKARPPSKWYLVSKFMRKNRGLVSAVVAVCLTLFVGVCATSWFWLESSKNARLATENATRQRQAKNEALREKNVAKVKSRRLMDVLDIVTGAFTSTNPARGGTSEMKAKDVLVNAEKQLAKSNLDGRGRAMLFDALSMSFHGLGEFPSAERTARESLKSLESVLESDDVDLWKARQSFARALHYHSDNDRAIQIIEECLVFWEQKFGEQSDEAIKALNLLATAYLRARRWDDAVGVFQLAVDRREAQLGEHDRLSVRSMHNLAVAHQFAGHLEKALPVYETSLKLMREIAVENDPAVLQYMYNLAAAYEGVGRIDESINIFEDVISRRIAKIGLEHPFTLATMLTIGRILIEAHRFEEAEKYLRLSYQTRKTNSEPDWTTYQTQSALGEAVAGLGRDEEALNHLEEAMTGLLKEFNVRSEPEYQMLNEAVDRLIQFAESRDQHLDLEKWRKLKAQIQSEAKNK